MTIFRILLAVVLSFAVVSRSAHIHSRDSNDVPIIDLGYAKYQGVFDSLNNITNYLGIRYAAPPTGQAPQTPTNNNGAVQQANAAPLQCFQAENGFAPANPLETINKRQSVPAQTEDCLFLNTYFPGDTVPTEPLPVLVFIHGGGYVSGRAVPHGGSDIMTEAHNKIVLVIIQYRLGLFGSEIKENGDLNAGLLDQDFALRWVQSHISKFGGDPTKVTIWGESAANSLACLRFVDANTLGTINANIILGGLLWNLPVHTSKSLKQGKVNGSNPMNASVYASMLFPKFGPQQAELTAQLYADLGTPLEQNNLIMGVFLKGLLIEKRTAIFVCPTFYLLSAFPGSSWKIPHGPTGTIRFAGPPSFNNTEFLEAFQGGFMAFVVSQNPNGKVAPTITPSWERYSKAHTEIIFNKTVTNEPDVRATPIDNGQLSRCGFWESVGVLTGQ
ncbi:Alpha/Beta hydrolase protein [Rhodocollybia butyracea]|uniref:Alpha/Beta hydrolase protein n=1 Tax=Rhodocollybia butyracea TaxID=206335 RepID=A0A9P5TZ51_9AGAR|nr:Alpha/Beta hydrolase protein [Rhodocollybia butyracea]